MNPVVDLAISTARSRGVVGVMSWISLRLRRVAFSSRARDSSTGRSGTIRPSNPAVAASLRISLHPEPMDDRVGDHRDHGRLVEPRRALGAERPQGLEDVRDLHPALERPVVARGDHRAVGDRVGVGNPDLDHVRAAADQLADEHARRGEVGIAGGHERHECAAFLVAEPIEERVDSVHGSGMGMSFRSTGSHREGYGVGRTPSRMDQ